jgi:hypothetical protein
MYTHNRCRSNEQGTGVGVRDLVLEQLITIFPSSYSMRGEISERPSQCELQSSYLTDSSCKTAHIVSEQHNKLQPYNVDVIRLLVMVPL